MTDDTLRQVPAARVLHVTKTYGRAPHEVEALRDVTLEFPTGRFTAVMGPSGSGKSTLMHVLAGLDTVTSGQVLLGDTDLTGLRDAELTRLRRKRVGFVFQAFNLVPTLDVRANVTLPFELDGRRPTAEESAWIDHLVGVLGLGSRLTHRPHELSGGQQQRVALARGLATRPDLLIADEPTGNLDSRSSREVLGLLSTAAHEYGQTIVMVTHDPLAASHADRLVVLADGRVVRELPRTAPEHIASLMLSMEGVS